MFNLIKAERDKISRNEQEDKAFSDLLDLFISGKMKSNDIIKVGTTPYVMRIAGAGVMPLTVKQTVLSNALATEESQVSNQVKKKHTEIHKIPKEILNELPKALRCPLAVAKGRHDNSMIVITDLNAPNKGKIYVSIELDRRGQRGKVNAISTISPRKNPDGLITDLIENGQLIAMHKKEADQRHMDNLAIPQESLELICFDNSIAYTTKNVKPLSEYLKEISQQKGAEKMKNPFEEYGFEPISEAFDEDLNRDTLYSIKVNGEIFYIELSEIVSSEIKNDILYWKITDENGMSLFHDELDRAENLSIRECIDYLSEYFPLVYGFSLEDREEFMKADLARFVAKASLSSDEWESLAYPLFEKNYIDKYKPSEKSILGHLGEPEVFEIARRFHNGEDIRKELALGLLDYNGDTEIVFGDDGITSSTYKYDRDTPRYKLHMEKAEDGVKLSLFDRERIVSYEEVGQTFIDMIHDEFDDLAFWWVRDDMKEAVPDISDETIRNILTAFDGAAIHGWENDQIKTNRIKKAIFDELGNEEKTEKAFAIIAKEKYHAEFEPESSIHFGLLGNGITAYDVSRTDPETHDYPTVAHISDEGVVKIYDDNISPQDMERINAQAQSAREKFMSDWDKLSPEQQFQHLLERADITTSVNISRDNSLSMEQQIEKYMPFVFFGEGERPEPALHEILFYGKKENLEIVVNASHTGAFGTTVIDGDRLSIMLKDDTTADDIRQLIDTAQNNSVYLNVPSAKYIEARFGKVDSYMDEREKSPISLELLGNSKSFTLYNYNYYDNDEDNSKPSIIERFNGDKDVGWLIDFKRELFLQVLNKCSFKEPDDWENQCNSQELSYGYETTLHISKNGNVSIIVSEYWYSNSYVTNYQEGDVRDSYEVILNEAEAKALMKSVSDYLKEHDNQANYPVFVKSDENGIREFYNSLMKQIEKEEKVNSDTEKLKYMGIETEPVRAELAKAAEISFDMLDDLIKNDDYFVELANDYLRCLQNQAMDKAKDNTAIISIPEYGLAVDLSKIDSLHLETEEWSYLGGTDSDGHERKDNYTKYKRSIDVQLTGNTIEFKKSDESDTWNPYDEHEFDDPQKKDIEIITSDIKEFIKKADDLSLVVYTITDGDKSYLECKPSTEVNSAYLRCDLYHVSRAYFSKELEKNMEHGDQDIVFTKFRFEGDMVKLYPGRYSDVTDVPDWEKVRASLLQPENGVDDNVRVRCEQFVINCGDERETRNERNATASELTVLEGYFKDTSRSDYSISNKLDNRLQRTYDDAEYVMMYLDPDDVVYDLLLNGEKKHTDSAEMSNSAFKGIYIMSNPRFALEQIKLNNCEWKKWDEAIMYMTDNKLSADNIDMVAVKCYDNDGRPGVKDLTPEGLYVLNQHTIKSSIAAGIARQKYEELMKRAEAERKEKENEPEFVKKNSGRK